MFENSKFYGESLIYMLVQVLLYHIYILKMSWKQYKPRESVSEHEPEQTVSIAEQATTDQPKKYKFLSHISSFLTI